MQEAKENQLIENAKNGDTAAFEVLVKLHQQTVLNMAHSMLGNLSDAEDVAQQVFINFYKKIDSFRGQAKLKTYLTRIAINLSLNEIKRKKNKGRWFGLFGSDEKAKEIADPNSNPIRQEKIDWVQSALKELEPDKRAVIVLRLMEGYSTKEVAEILKIPQGTVLSKLSRARQKLKQHLILLDEENLRL